MIKCLLLLSGKRYYVYMKNKIIHGNLVVSTEFIA